MTKSQKEIYKELIDYITSNIDDIEINSDIKSQFQYIYPKLLFVFVKIPKAIYTLNKYLNDLFLDINSPDNIKQILDTLRFIIQKNNINKNDLHSAFYGYIYNDKYEFYEMLEKINDDVLTDSDKRFIYYLYYAFDKNKDVFNKYISEKRKKKPEQIKGEKLQQINELLEQNKPKIETLDELYEYILEELQSKIYCHGCPLINREKLIDDEKEVIFDTNLELNSPVDNIEIAFIGINPGETEVKEGKPFVGKSGKVLREKINEVISNDYGYIITNVIFCATKNQDDLKSDLKKITKKCNYYKDILKQLSNLKLVVLFGDIPKQVFGIKGRITTLYDKIFEVDNYKVIVLPHPSALLRNSKASINAWEKGWETITQYITSNIQKKNFNVNTNTNINTNNNTTGDNKPNINLNTNNKFNNIQTISQIPQDETLFDIRVLEEQNKYLIITSDKEGNKKYYLLPFKFVFYVKENTPPQFCKYFEDINNLSMRVINDYNTYQKIKYKMNDMMNKLIKK